MITPYLPIFGITRVVEDEQFTVVIRGDGFTSIIIEDNSGRVNEMLLSDEELRSLYLFLSKYLIKEIK